MSSTPSSTPGAERGVIVVSTDTHAAPATFERFLDYVDPAHRQGVADYGAIDLSGSLPSIGAGNEEVVGEITETDPVRRAVIRKARRMSIDSNAAEDWFNLYSQELVFPDDADGKRLAALETLGVHAEVTYPNPHLAGSLPKVLGNMTTVNREGPLELFWPALHAYNRWLADFCNAAPGRRAGVVQISLHDMPTALAELKWARDAGIFGGVRLPPMGMDLNLPGYSDEYYEPFWSACEDYDMVVNIHTGGDAGAMAQMYDAKNGPMITLYEVFLFTRRPLWFMVLSGVFDRHPKLKVVVAENGLQWYPALIRDLELVYNGHSGSPIRSRLKMSPREYFHKHIWLGGSVMQKHEADNRHEIGLDRIMWGSDYPHLEGAPPVHRQVMRYILGDLPDEDARLILGKTAIDLWGFDAGLLQGVADRVGPSSTELHTPISVEEIEKAFGWSIPRHVPVVRAGAVG